MSAVTTGDPPLNRSLFPVTEQYCFLDHAGIAVLPTVSVEVMDEASRDLARRGSVAFPEWEARQEQVRASAARLMGVPTDDVAFVKNTTEGLAFVANGLAWRSGDRVVVPNHEFPSTIYPFLALRDRGVTVDLVEPVGEGGTLPIELFERALAGGPTRLVVCSWVQFGRAWRTDLPALAALCHDHGALLCVDVIQGLGVIPADLEAWGVDFATADAHKWMLGPLGCGVLYVAGRNLELLRPMEPGWASVAHREEWDNLDLVYDSTSRRFEGGSTSVMAIAGMGRSIDLLLTTGVDRIWAHVGALGDRLAAGLELAGARVLSDRSVSGRAAHLTFALADRDPEADCETLQDAGFVASARGGGIRAGPHGYNTAAEIDAFVAAVASLR